MSQPKKKKSSFLWQFYEGAFFVTPATERRDPCLSPGAGICDSLLRYHIRGSDALPVPRPKRTECFAFRAGCPSGKTRDFTISTTLVIYLKKGGDFIFSGQF